MLEGCIELSKVILRFYRPGLPPVLGEIFRFVRSTYNSYFGGSICWITSNAGGLIDIICLHQVDIIGELVYSERISGTVQLGDAFPDQ